MFVEALGHTEKTLGSRSQGAGSTGMAWQLTARRICKLEPIPWLKVCVFFRLKHSDTTTHEQRLASSPHIAHRGRALFHALKTMGGWAIVSDTTACSSLFLYNSLMQLFLPMMPRKCSVVGGLFGAGASSKSPVYPVRRDGS